MELAAVVHIKKKVNKANSHDMFFPGDTMYKNLLSSVGDMHSISSPGRFHMPRSN